MGVDWKIYKPKSKVKPDEFIHSVNLLVEKFPDASIKVTSTKWLKEEIRKLNRLRLTGLEEYRGTVRFTKGDELLKFYTSENLLDFGIFRNSNSSKEDIFGFKIMKSSNQEKPTLSIELPYSNKRNSINELVALLNHLNKPLWLNFRNKEQIEFTVNKFINNIFDDKYNDDEWTLKHSHHIYKLSGTIKEHFENQLDKTFRATGVQILFPETIGKIKGWKEYKKNLFSEILSYFNQSEFELYFSSKKEELPAYLLNTELISIELSSVFDVTSYFKKGNNLDFQFLLKGDKSQISIELEPTINSTEFTFYLYRIKNDELEIRLEIDKNAEDDFIELLISSTGIDMNYSHEE